MPCCAGRWQRMATRLHTRRRFAGGDESKFDALSENFVAPKKVTHTPESYQEIVWVFFSLHSPYQRVAPCTSRGQQCPCRNEKRTRLVCEKISLPSASASPDRIWLVAKISKKQDCINEKGPSSAVPRKNAENVWNEMLILHSSTRSVCRCRYLKNRSRIDEQQRRTTCRPAEAPARNSVRR